MVEDTIVEKWMIQKLGLSGNEVLVFSLIYGECDENGHCIASVRSMSDFFNVSPATIKNVINKLISKNLVSKELAETPFGGVINCYRVNMELIGNKIC